MRRRATALNVNLNSIRRPQKKGPALKFGPEESSWRVLVYLKRSTVALFVCLELSATVSKKL
jgi:hypothetical protein